MRRLLIILPLLLTACAQQKYWTKYGSTSQDFNQDRYSCLQSSSAQAPAATSFVALSGANPMLLPVDVNQGNRNDLFNACMNSKGWSLESKQSSLTETEQKQLCEVR
jgi:hypothetical protein